MRTTLQRISQRNSLSSIVKLYHFCLFGNIELKEKVAAKLVTMIERKMAEAFEARRNIRPRSKSPEIKSREPSPTD